MRQGIRVHTILFSEACPLNCRYCDLRNGESFGKEKPLTFEEICAQIAYYDKQDNKDNISTRLVFTGGEPFLYWEWIKKIILQYGNKLQYEFNTSGYLLTEEIITFLSQYQYVHFYLSVDGNELLTNYLRPTRDTLYHVGYFKRFKEIVPTLLYYYPATSFKMIVNPRYVDLVYEQWKTAINLGFLYFHLTLDFESRPNPPQPINKPRIIWNDEHTKILREQIDLIVKDICLGFKNGIAYPRVNNLDSVIQWLLTQKNQGFDPMKLPCQVFSGRTLSTMYKKDVNNYCMSAKYPMYEDAIKKLELLQQQHICKFHKTCPAFDYCIQQGCPQHCVLDQDETVFYLDELDCVLNSIFYDEGLKLIYICNNMCPESILYKDYLSNFVAKEG